jgi:D-cysteine desulfhydrase family pyridoxal phosphate-dependent enzyme
MAAADEPLIPPHPRVALATLPTPLERAARLEAALRGDGVAGVPAIYLKRDDVLSLGLGGNKIRNLEFLVGAALDAGVTDVITGGRLQSNHCRLTAAACARTGLRAHLVFADDEPRVYSGNLLLDRLLGARLYFAGAGDGDRDRRAAMVERVAEDVRRQGGRPDVISVGGSGMIGALGHVLAAAEIVDQCISADMSPGAIVLATATGGTQAGLLAGLRKLGRRTRVVGFAVAKSAEELRETVRALAGEVAAEIGVGVAAEHIDVRDAVGAGYGVPSPEGQAAIELLAHTEGVLADPVYTGKALAAFLAAVRSGDFSADGAVVFIHTGGTPALFAQLPATSL